MRVFLYEFVSGGGCFHHSITRAPEGALLAEGLAMWQALYDDFDRIDGVEVTSTRDARLPPITQKVIPVGEDDTSQFLDIARQSDFTLVIAPEFDGHLRQRVCMLEKHGCSHLGCSVDFIDIAANKTLTAERLGAADVRVPRGQLIRAAQGVPQDFVYPAVLKVNDGAGSMGHVVASPPIAPMTTDMRVEELVAGIACSQSWFCFGNRQLIACPPMRQHLALDGSLHYSGGGRLMDAGLVGRATNAARRAILALPPTNGYVGVDLVLGESSDGDFVIEVNPRLTTSYIGLRQLTRGNLAEVMLQIAQGIQPTVVFDRHPVRFQADGTVER